MEQSKRQDGMQFLRATGWSDVIDPELTELVAAYEQAAIHSQLGMESKFGSDAAQLAAMAWALRRVHEGLRKYFEEGRIEKGALKDKLLTKK